MAATDRGAATKRSASAAGLDEDEEGATCPLCMEKWNVNKSKKFWSCCMNEICVSCADEIGSGNCPFCRTPRYLSNEEKLASIRWNAANGNPTAILQLGSCYARGEHGLKKDSLVAAAFYVQAVELGDVTAMYNLGCLYKHGNGVKLDKKKAVKYWRTAADRGHAGAQFNLGLCFQNGDGVPQDDAEAFRFFKLSADQGLTKAEHNMGAMYANGQGVAQDTAEATDWYGRAAAKGFMKAIEALIKLAPLLAAERDYARSGRDAARTERNAARAERNAARTERDAARAERDAALAERDAALTKLRYISPS